MKTLRKISIVLLIAIMIFGIKLLPLVNASSDDTDLFDDIDNDFEDLEEEEKIKTVNIDLIVNEVNQIDFPVIISAAYDESFYGSEISFECENCELDLDNEKILIQSNQLGEGTASVKIIGGMFDEYMYIYNYNMVESQSINVIGIDTEYTGRTTYVEGEDFDTSLLKVFLVYDNNATVETNDYIIEDNEDLTTDDDSVRISYGDYEVFISIFVISNDDSRVVRFNDPVLFDYFIESGWDYESGLVSINPDELELVCLSDFFDGSGNGISIDDVISDLTGLSNFYNLDSLNLSKYNSNSLDEISRIENLRQLILVNSDNPITDISPLSNSVGLRKIELYNEKIKSIESILNSGIESMTITNMFDIDELEHEDNRVYLPEIYAQMLGLCENAEITVFYNTNTSTINELKQTDDGKYYVELDTEIYENQDFEKREIYIEINDSQNEIYLLSEIDYRLAEDVPEDPKEPLKDFGYPIENNELVVDVKSKTNIELFKTKFMGENDIIVEVLSADDEIIEANDINVATGMKIKLKNKNNEYIKDDEDNIVCFTIVVRGDINGDGKADLRDSRLIKGHRNEIQGLQLDGIKFEAADINRDNKINFIDSNLMKLHINEVQNYNLDE